MVGVNDLWNAFANAFSSALATKSASRLMNKVSWKQKLTSRKFWVVAVGFVMLIVFSVDTLTVEQTTGIITAGGALVAYVLAEGYVDGKRAKSGG